MIVIGQKTILRHAQEWLLVAIPMMIYGAAYRLLRFIPRIAAIDTSALYEAEVRWFGFNGQTLCEWFAVHNWPLLDAVCGICYICWVPLPILFAFWLYFTRRRECLRFTVSFMMMNLVGFTIYYIHPAAPPWYVIEHGFVPDPSTIGNAAGLLRFDRLIGYPLFESMYRGTTNVFAALPSLHSAKVPFALLFAVLIHHREHSRSSLVWVAVLAMVSVGTWFGAVYTSHHYIIDVLAGIALVPAGYLLFLWFIAPTHWFRRLENCLKCTPPS